MTWAGWLLLGVVFAWMPATLAARKGHSYLAYYVLGILFLPLALAIALIVRPSTAPGSPLRQCPHCAEFVQRKARVCRYCTRELEPVHALAPSG